MAKYKVGIIGTGRPWRTEGARGSGLSHVHANGYRESADCELVAAADLVQENVDSFCHEHHIAHGYTDYKEMLEKEDLDIVSIAVWRPMHTPMIVDAARAGVKAIHCEKPMAHTWANAKQQVAVCKEHGVQLTFNHQNRFVPGHRKAKALLDAGAIGQPLQIIATGSDLFEVGTHWMDLMFFMNNDVPAKWVIGQIDAGKVGRFRMPIPEVGQAVSFFQFENGVYGQVNAKGGAWDRGMHGDFPGMDAYVRVIGTEGIIDAGVLNGPECRMLGKETGGVWKDFTFPYSAESYGEKVFQAAENLNVNLPGHQWQTTMPWIAQIAANIFDLVDALNTGREPECSGDKALRSAEVSFATYESSRRRGVVNLPLDVDDNAFITMLEEGVVKQEQAEQ